MSPDKIGDVGAGYDVFLSHNGADSNIVVEIAHRLERMGVCPWVDRWALTPGGRWQEELADGLRRSAACAVFIGPHDLGAWERLEMSVAQNRAATERGFRIFPVLLPGMEPFDPSTLPAFLALQTWVDLRPGPLSTECLQELVNAVHGLPRRTATGTRDDSDECPYLGLAVFEEAHERYFFGRDALAQRLLEKVRQGRFVAVLGSSGSGKSSLVRAGLLPRLRAGAVPGTERWHLTVLRPSAEPATVLAAQLTALRPGPGMAATLDQLLTDPRTVHLAAELALVAESPEARLLLVVDQFEEVFTLCRDAAERAAFVANLQHAVTVPGGRVAVVLAMRADFYPQLARFPEFAQTAESHQLLVGPPGDDELRQVIEEPARVVGLDVEEGLAATIVDDLVREQCSLPLLEHALLETWRHRRGGMLTLEGYQATGGVRRGLGDRAEAIYGALSARDQELTRHLFLRLVQPGEGTEDTRRRIELAEMFDGGSAVELDGRGDGDGDLDGVVGRFAAERLLTTGSDGPRGERWVEISHEALIAGWTRLAGWVADDRAGLLVHRRLTLATQEWRRLGESSDALYRGVPLLEAVAWRDRGDRRLSAAERTFLQASVDADRAAAQARQRRVRRAFVALVVALVVIGATALVAVNRGLAAAGQRDIALSRQFAASARTALDVDPAVALTLALRAYDVTPTDQATEVLRQATADSRNKLVIHGPVGGVLSVRFLPGEQSVITGHADGSIRVWDLRTGQLTRTITAHTGTVFAVRVSPDGQTLASAADDGAVVLTTLADGRSRTVLRTPTAQEYASSVEFSHRGNTLAVPVSDGTVHLVDVATGHDLTLHDPTGAVLYNAAWSPDDATVAAADRAGTVDLFDARGTAAPRLLRAPRGAVIGVEFSPSGSQLVSTGEDGSARVWDVASGQPGAELPSGTQTVYVAHFFPDGQRLAVAGQDGSIQLWDGQGVRLATLRGHIGNALDIALSRDGATLLSGGEDGTIRAWDTTTDVVQPGPVTAAQLSPDGTRVAASGTDGNLRMWTADGLRPVYARTDGGARGWATWSADGSTLITYGEDGRVDLRDPADGHVRSTFDPGIHQVWSVTAFPTDRRMVLGGDTGAVLVVDEHGTVVKTLSEAGQPVNATAVGPDGRTVVAGRQDGTFTIWGPDGRPTTVDGGGGMIAAAAYSPDGQRIATAEADGSVRIWRTDGSLVRPLLGHQGAATAVRFTQDGTAIVTGGTDGSVRVWDAHTYQALVDLHSDGAADGVDVSPDGQHLIKSSETGASLRLVSCRVCGPVASVLALARSLPPRELTPAEEQRFVS